MLYALIAFGASLVGAVSGLGGGVIIKPLLDLLDRHGVSTISLLSSVTVFAMSAAALLRHLSAGGRIQLRLGALLSAGAILGGYGGNFLFDRAMGLFSRPAAMTLVQNGLLTALLTGVLVYMNRPRDTLSFQVRAPSLLLGTGVCLGAVSSFLGIGGGPVNVAVLTLLFSMETRAAAVHSILLIFFSQAAKLTTVWLEGGFGRHDLGALWVMVPAGICGGLLGARLNQKLPAEKIAAVFNGAMLAILALALLNTVRALFAL